jgi:hypothetical protein
MSLEMAQKVIVPQKKNYVPQFLKQRDINSYCSIGKKPFKVNKNASFNMKNNMKMIDFYFLKDEVGS